MTGFFNRLATGPALLLAVLLAACGQRGPLYLPEDAPAVPPPENSAGLPPEPETGTLPRDALEGTAETDDPDRVFADDFDANTDIEAEEHDERR